MKEWVRVRDVQVGTYGCFVLIAEAFVDILIHEGRFPNTEEGIRTVEATASIMITNPLSPRMMTLSGAELSEECKK